MSAGSPTAYLLWSILSVTFLIFLLTHLWTYDRFQCIKWNTGRQPGAFKRLMTYTYLTNIPLLVVFSVGMARVKYHEGFIIDPSNNHLVPKPSAYWSDESTKWLLPLYFCLSFSWALEIITHLEELTFWVFLLHQGPNQRQWFRSWEFRMWYIGSTMAIIGLPLTTLLARQDLSTTLAWIFLVGSLASSCTTICFFYVLARFPYFIEQVKAEGAEPSVVVRLVTFYQLNRIRVVFRFLFTVPFFIIATDGIQPPYPILEDLFASDLLFMLGAIGSFVSSGITLFIFFPRSITEEQGYTIQERVLGSTGTDFMLAQAPYSPQDPQASKADIHTPCYNEAVDMQQFDSTPISRSGSLFSFSLESGPIGSTPGYETEGESTHRMPQLNHIRMTRRSMPSQDLSTQTDNSTLGYSRHITRRHSDGENLCGQVTNVAPWKPANVSALRRRPSLLDRYLLKFTSPIDLPDDDDS